MKSRIRNFHFTVLLIAVLFAHGCAHYHINEPITSLNSKRPAGAESDNIAILLTFSGGGTRAAAFSYGVLEELADRTVQLDGKEKRLLDEVAVISSVSGGSFTAAYYGLFGDRIFDDFETKFLKKNIQDCLLDRIILNPVNWVRLASPYFDRSDLVAEYYDEHIFEKVTFGDMAKKRGPIVVINATDMTSGMRVDFTTEMFNAICSDLWNYPVARAVAASSAVPGIFTPITLRNYAGKCNYQPREIENLDTPDIDDRQSLLLRSAKPYLDSKKKKYVRLLDGALSDNLGLRAIMDRIMVKGSIEKSIKGTPLENVKKFVFIIVNAQAEPDFLWDRMEAIPPLLAMIDSSATVAVQRYNVETLALLKEGIKGCTGQNRATRWPIDRFPNDHSCADKEFYVVQVDFDEIRDEKEREYLNKIPTSFNLEPEQVDKLRAAARKILGQSREFERFIKNLESDAKEREKTVVSSHLE